jgi:hypothetical protein
MRPKVFFADAIVAPLALATGRLNGSAWPSDRKIDSGPNRKLSARSIIDQ